MLMMTITIAPNIDIVTMLAVSVWQATDDRHIGRPARQHEAHGDAPELPGTGVCCSPPRTSMRPVAKRLQPIVVRH